MEPPVNRPADPGSVKKRGLKSKEGTHLREVFSDSSTQEFLVVSQFEIAGPSQPKVA